MHIPFWKSLLIIFRRYLPRFLRERYRQGRPSHRMATPARIGLYPFFRPHVRHLLLPRVASLVDEAR
jgi:hypothetical protein